jgi:hypothetical protein
MGLFEAKGQIDRGMKDLLLRWNLARAQWRDNTAAEFEQQHLVPLQGHVRNATTAMSSAAGLVSTIKAECSDRD